MHTCIHAYMHTCIHAYMHTCMHTYIHTYIHAYIHTYIAYTCVNMYTHTRLAIPFALPHTPTHALKIPTCAALGTSARQTRDSSASDVGVSFFGLPLPAAPPAPKVSLDSRSVRAPNCIRHVDLRAALVYEHVLHRRC